MSPNNVVRPSRPDDTVERDLVRWSWIVGGWAGVHAAIAIVALVMGAELNASTLLLRMAAFATVAGWATAAIASWRFRRSFRLKVGFLAAGASLIAGATLPVVGDASTGATVDGLAHVAAGLGFALVLWSARRRLGD